MPFPETTDKSADALLLTGGDIWVFGPESSSPGRAGALLACGAIIRSVGDAVSEEEIYGYLEREKCSGGIRRIELEGRTVLPAFIDAHMHFYQMAASCSSLSLEDAVSLEDALEKTRKFVAGNPDRKRYLARGFDESGWPGKRFPTRKELDEICPGKPLFWKRICGHVAVANTVAMKVLDRDTKESGILREAAAHEAGRRFSPGGGEIIRNMAKAIEAARSLGICGIGEIVVKDDAGSYLDMARSGNFPGLHFRLNIVANDIRDVEDAAKLMGEIRHSARTGGFSCGLTTGIKLFADGSFGARTAALSEDYSDGPGERGSLLHSTGELTEMIIAANSHGLPVMIHAIGDAAIEQAVTAYENTRSLLENGEENGNGNTKWNRNECRNSIEHMELPTSTQIDRAAETGVIACIQPNFALNWAVPGGLNEQRLGRPRAERSDPVRTISDSMFTAFGSDGMPFSPLYGIRGAVDHPVKRERISLFQAVKCYTCNAAYMLGLEGVTGSIENGKRADMVILSDRLTRDNLEDIEVDMTISGGKAVYRRK